MHPSINIINIQHYPYILSRIQYEASLLENVAKSEYNTYQNFIKLPFENDYHSVLI